MNLYNSQINKPDSYISCGCLDVSGFLTVNWYLTRTGPDFVLLRNSQNVVRVNTVKALLSPLLGAYLISDLREGGFLERGHIREGVLFTKSSDKDILGSFSVLLSHILRNHRTILRLKYINSTQFLSQTILKLTCKVV